MALISVIIPAYNAEKTIQETINSVLNQTFSDFELIVINDGSQDSTLKVVSNITDPRIKIFSYPNSGPQKSRNLGIAKASGEYISFIDADDLWTPDKLKSQLEALQENHLAAVAYSWTDYIDERGNFLHPGVHVTEQGYVYTKLLALNFLENGSNPLIRRQALVEVGDFDELIVAAQDWDMWLRLAERYHFVGVPFPQVLYRVSSNSWSANLSRLEAGCLQVLERSLARAPQSLQALKRYSRARFYKGFSCKALVSGPPGRQRGLAAAKFLWLSVINDPSVLRQVRFIAVMLVKIAVTATLPHQQAQALLSKVKNKEGFEIRL